MDAAQQSVETIFDAALELTNPSERAALLDRACAGNPQVRARVDKLLAAHTRAEGFFSDCAPALAISDSPESEPRPAPPSPAEDPVGSRIGPYKLLQKIGEGGCGLVYMAEQEKPVRRRVALKIIKLGMDTKQVIARFEAERQALAMMNHPNIARVLDAGATETGRPYFVMELVHGIRITEYCDQHSLSTRERLELFIQVCHAIQHAHQKGIIHRDIKPSNVLVTLHDGVPVPKVIDFGIAKAMEEKLTDKTLFTMFGHFIGTPAYMSPEQAQMSGLDVDTRSDIYSLGVLLYELLTGKTPFDQKELMAAGLDEMRRTLREREPHRPSTKLDTLPNTELTMTAQQRHIEPPGLRSELQGDLDWIVMKALEKDRTRRYETANGLALDLVRFLHDEPVMARPPSRLYRFKKLVQRNRVVFTAIGAVSAALIVGLGLSTWMFMKERAARRRAVLAERVADEARENETKLRQQAELRERVTFLVSRGEFASADEQLSSVEFDKPTIEGAAVLRSLGQWHALRGNWPTAAVRYQQLLKVNQLDSWDVASLDFLSYGATVAEANDAEKFAGLVAEIVTRSGAQVPPTAAARLLKMALLRPADEKTLRALEPLARVAIPQFSLTAPELAEAAATDWMRQLTLIACGKETAGTMSKDHGLVTLTAGGMDVWKREDSFDFACMMVPGDFDFRLRVQSVTKLDKFTRVGLMARDSLKNPASRFVMVAVNAEDTFQVLVRPKVGAEAISLPQNPLPKAWGSNSWVRLQRAGSLFRAFSSDNGRDWVLLDYYESANDSEGPLAGPIHFGIAACAHSTNELAVMNVSDFGVTSAASPNAMLASALMRYRSGNYAQCVELCRRNLSRPGFNAPGIAVTRTLLALASRAQGQTEEVHAQLSQAREMVEKNLAAQMDVGSEAQGYWFDWVFARALLREADEAAR